MNNLNPILLRQLKQNASWFLVLGILLVILGTLAVVFSFYSTLFSILYLGSLLIVAGVIEGVKSIKMRPLKRFLLHLALGILYFGSGVYLVANPEINAITLTLLLAIFFMVSGALRIMFALMADIPHKGWLLVNGLLTFILGILIYQQWPVSGLWVIGMFVGIDLMFTGYSWIMLSLAAKDLKTDF